MNISILGAGCTKCERLAELVGQVVLRLGVEARIEQVSRAQAQLSHDPPAWPALVVGGMLISAGSIPSWTELASWIKIAAALESSKRRSNTIGGLPTEHQI